MGWGGGGGGRFSASFIKRINSLSLTCAAGTPKTDPPLQVTLSEINVRYLSAIAQWISCSLFVSHVGLSELKGTFLLSSLLLNIFSHK